MKIKQKQINYLLLLFLSIFIIIPNLVFAHDDATEKGKLNIKTERITGNESDANQELVETELERTFPDLFEDETKEKIELKQKEEEVETNYIKQQIFQASLPSSTAIYEVKSELFTEDYTPPKKVVQEDEEDDETNNSSPLVVYGSIVSMIGIVLGGIFLVIRNLGA